MLIMMGGVTAELLLFVVDSMVSPLVIVFSLFSDSRLDSDSRITLFSTNFSYFLASCFIRSTDSLIFFKIDSSALAFSFFFSSYIFSIFYCIFSSFSFCISSFFFSFSSLILFNSSFFLATYSFFLSFSLLLFSILYSRSFFSLYFFS